MEFMQPFDPFGFFGLMALVYVVLRLLEPMMAPRHGRLYSDKALASLVKREARKRARQTPHAVPSVGAIRPPRPFTPAQQALYHDMRAKGWSELATQQACERLTTRD